MGAATNGDSLPRPYYADEWTTIYCGDNRAILAAPSFPTVDLTVTSPPYNQMARMGDRGGMHGGGKWVRQNEDTAYIDDLDENEYRELHIGIASLVRDVTRPGGSMFYNHKVRYRDGEALHPLDLVRGFDGWRLRQEVIWHTGAVAFNARMFAPSDERIYWLVNGDGAHKWNQEAAGFLTVWRMLPPTMVDGHPCPFPIDLPTRCIVAATDPGDLVLDPFMGSGTTLRAAKDTGRRAIGIDREERYCEIAARRLGQEVLDLGGVA